MTLYEEKVMDRKNLDIERICIFLFLTLFAIIFLLYLTYPISDVDFFWHIATGKWIAQNHSLPQSDPFSYTTPVTPSDRAKFILTSYWLSQTLYYFIYYLGGYGGIMGMRFVIVSLLCIVLYKLGRPAEKSVVLGIIFLVMIVLLRTYPMERPQVFSFLFFAVLLYQLNQLCTVSPLTGKYLLPLPFTMLLWSNVHGGHLLGQAVLVIYVLAEALKFIRPGLKPMGKHQYLKFLIPCGLALLTSTINPNTYKAMSVFLGGGELMTVVEYQSTVTAFLETFLPQIVIYWVLLLVALVATVYNAIKRRLNITEVFLLIALGYFSFMTMRFVPFFLISAVPATSQFISKVSRQRIAKTAVLCMSLIVFAYFLTLPGAFNNLKNLIHHKADRLVSDFFPGSAVTFIEAEGLKGNMYNYYDWGGYLIWRLSPQRKVFIDNRQLDERIFLQSTYIDAARMKPQIMNVPLYKGLLNIHEVKYVITPLFDVRGTIVPLLTELLKDDEWVPVFLFRNSAILVKRTPENYDLIYRHSIRKDFFVGGMFHEIDSMIESSPMPVHLFIAKGDLFYHFGMTKEAREAYQNALKILPFNEIASERLRRLDAK